MAIQPAILLLFLVIFLTSVLFMVFKGRNRWVLLTTLSIILVVVLVGVNYVTNFTFRRDFTEYFQPTSQYVDKETNAVLPLPAHTAFGYRYAEHAVVYFTNKSPEEVVAFYQTLKGLTMKAGPSPSPGMSLYKVTYKGKDMTVTIIPDNKSFDCQIAISS